MEQIVDIVGGDITPFGSQWRLQWTGNGWRVGGENGASKGEDVTAHAAAIEA